MGYIRHDAILAMTFDDYSGKVMKEKIKKINLLKEKMEKDDFDSGIILGPFKGINGYITFVYAPDGSKEGWEESDKSDKFRGEFTQIFNGTFDSYISLTFGGDDFGISCEFHEDNEMINLHHWED